MPWKSLLKRVQKHPGLVYPDRDLTPEKEPLVWNVTLRPRTKGRALCSGWGRKRPGYDTLPPRRFAFLPFWGILGYFVEALRRAEGPPCGSKGERVPWAEGQRTGTTASAWFRARWAKHLRGAEGAAAFQTSGDTVDRSIERAGAWGRAPRDLDGITALGVAARAWGKGPR